MRVDSSRPRHDKVSKYDYTDEDKETDKRKGAGKGITHRRSRIGFFSILVSRQ
jgi:hypothetical protein